MRESHLQMRNVSLSERHGRFFFALQLSAHRVRKVADRKLAAATELTATQAAVLYVLATRKGIMQKQIAALLGQNESAVTAMVARLMKLGFVRRCKSRDDQRIFELILTKSGQKQLEIAQPEFGRLDRMLDAALSLQELDSLTLLLMRVATAFASG